MRPISFTLALITAVIVSGALAAAPASAAADQGVDDTGQPGATLALVLADATTGAPLHGYCVYLDTTDGRSACTDGTQLTVDDLPAGTFSLSIDVGSASFYLNRWDVRATLVAGQTTSLTVPMELGGKVTTTVTARATGQPVPDTCVALKVLGRGGLGDDNGIACSDERGLITTPPLSAAVYEMFALAPEGYGHQWVGRTGGTGDQRAASRIRVRPGRAVAAPAVRLDRAGTISGTVTNADGSPAGDGYVSYTAWDLGAGPSHGVDVDASGDYTLAGLGPYSWPLLFQHDGLRQWSGGTGDRFEARTIKVRSGKVTSYDARLRAGTALAGTVTLAPGVSDQWRLTAVNAETGDPVGERDSFGTVDGAYRLNLIGGQRVQVSWYWFSDEQSHVGWYDHATDRADATTVPVPRGAVKRLDVTIY